MADTLTALDGTFLRPEKLDGGALMSIGGVMVFDPPAGGGAPTVEAVRKHLAARLRELPRYSQRLSSARTGWLAWPHWVHDERFDIRHHVGHAELPAPGDDRQLSDWTAEFFSHALDRNRPLWQMVLVEGLEGGHWALARRGALSRSRPACESISPMMRRCGSRTRRSTRRCMCRAAEL